MEKNFEVVEVNNKAYIILKEIKHEQDNYLYLSNIEDPKDVLIRKNELLPLESLDEYELACNLLLYQYS